MIVAGIGCRTGVSAEAILVLMQQAAASVDFSVMRGLDPRTYPLRRPDGVAAPRRVGPRNECADDDAFNLSVMRGLDPRTYPLRRPDGVAAPRRVDPRNACADADAFNHIASLAIPDFRRAEPGVTEAATRLRLPILWIDRAALKGEQGRCLTRSARAEAETGFACVAEAAALAGAGPGSRLVLPRIAGGGVTCALAEGPGR